MSNNDHAQSEVLTPNPLFKYRPRNALETFLYSKMSAMATLMFRAQKQRWHGFSGKICQSEIALILNYRSRIPKLYTVVGLTQLSVCNWAHVKPITHTGIRSQANKITWQITWSGVPSQGFNVPTAHIWVMRDHVIEWQSRDPEHARYMELLRSKMRWAVQHHHIWAWSKQHS